MRRRIAPFATAAAVFATAALTACSTAGSAEFCEPLVPEGPLSKSVSLSGETADTLQVTVDPDASQVGAQRSVVRESETGAPVVTADGIVSANLAYVDPATGEVLEVAGGFGGDRGETLFLASSEQGTLVSATFCASPGDTLAISLSPDESAAMGAPDGLVVIAEITDFHAPRAEGKNRLLPSGFPAVTNDDTGRPGIVLPPQQAPSETRSALRIEGDGETVKPGDAVIGQVLTVGWDGRVQRNSWLQGPVNFGNEEQIAQSGASFRAALNGVPIGSQVVVIEAGDGDAPAQVHVVDLLALA